MRRNTKINRVMWAVVFPNGQFQTKTIRQTRRECLAQFQPGAWDKAKKQGCEIIKVRVQEI